MSYSRLKFEALEARVLLSGGEAVAEAPPSAQESFIVVEVPAETEIVDQQLNAQDLLPFEWWEGPLTEIRSEETDPERSLNAQSVTVIPDRAEPATAATLLLAPGGTSLPLPASSRGLAGLWRFAPGMDSELADVRFRMTSSSNAPIDFALVLYDADGNQLQVADEFGSGSGSLETLHLPGLATGRTYLIGVVSQLPFAADTYSVVAEALDPVLQAPISVNPATGTASYSAVALSAILQSSSEQHIHPLILLNLGDRAAVRVLPSIADSDLSLAIYRRNLTAQLGNVPSTPRYTLEASGSTTGGAAVELNLKAEAGSTLSEEDYVLVVAPKGFAARAGPYRVDVTTDAPLLATGIPVRASFLAGQLFVQRPTEELGIAGAEFKTESLEGLTEKFYRFRTPSDGNVRIEVQAAFNSVVSLYTQTGPALLDVATGSAGGLAVINETLETGMEYYVRVAEGAGRGLGFASGFTIKLETPYAWRELAPNYPASGVARTGIGTLGVGGASSAPVFYRISPDERIDFLSITLPGGPSQRLRISVQGQGFTQEVIAPLGGLATLPVQLLGRPGPLYVSFSSEVGSFANNILYIGQLVLPRELPLDAFAGRKASIVTGDISQSNVNLSAFGARAGFAYYQLLTTPGQSSRWTVTGDDGTLPLLVRYAENGSVLRMQEFAVSDQSDTVTVQRQLPSERLYAMAVFQLGVLLQNGKVSLEADNPAPIPVGVGMVPDLEYENRPQFQFGSIPIVGQVGSQYQFQVEPIRYGSILKIEPITFENDFEQDLWETILPENFFAGSATESQAWPVLRLAPEAAGSDLQLRLTIYDGEGDLLRRTSGTFVTSFTSDPGQALYVNFANLGIFRSALIGQKLRFRVEAMAGQLGDGVYSLKMTVRTTNSHPYEANETAWKFSGSTIERYFPGDNVAVGALPAGTVITDIVQNQFGDGSIVGSFNSPGVNVDVYRFWVPLSGPLKVWTSPFGADPANTAIKLYRARFIVERESERTTWETDVDYLGELRTGSTGISGNGDWFQADRSEIDSQIVISDPQIARYTDSFDGVATNPPDPIFGTRESDLAIPYLPKDAPLNDGGYYLYVVVKNEQGSQGRYVVHVDAGDLPLFRETPVLMPLRPTAQALGSVVSVEINEVENYRNLLGYLPIQMPERHAGYLEVEGHVNATWDFQLFDRLGNRIFSTIADDNQPPDSARFSIPSGPQIVYLRAREHAAAPSSNELRLETTLLEDADLPTSFSSLNLDGVAHRILPTDPFGDLALGDFSDGVSIDSSGRVYRLSVPPGRITIGVNLLEGSNVSALWGIYANGRLLSWDKAIPGNDASQQTELLLPGENLPGSTGAFQQFHTLLLVVRHSSGSVQPAQFRITVDTHRNLGATFLGATSIPLPPGALEVGTTRGSNVTDTAPFQIGGDDRWRRLVVPDELSGGLVIADLPANANLYPLRYDLYDAAGKTLIASGLRQERGDLAAMTLSQVEGGKAYLLRITPRDQAAAFPLRYLYSLPKAAANLYSVPPTSKPTQFVVDESRARPNVNGDFSLSASLAGKTDLWVLHDVGNSGPARFTVTFKGSDNVRMSVYRQLPPSGPDGSDNVGLVDYVNEANMTVTADGKVLVLDTFLQSGIHYVELKRSNSAGGQVLLEAETPEYDVETILLDPNLGESRREHLGIDNGSLGTRFFRARAPEGSFGEATFEAVDVLHTDNSSAEGNFSRQGFFVVTEAAGGWGQVGGGISNTLSTTLSPGALELEKARLITPSTAKPFTTYLIAVHGTGGAGRIGVRAIFEVPQSGTPDLVVESILLKPNAGQTLVEISVRNRGYASASSSQALFSYPSVNPADPIVAELFEGTLGPQARRVHLLDWIDPVSPNDVTRYEVDVANAIAELDETNNAASVTMKTVNAHRPTISVSLAEGRDGNSDPGVWGRYVDSRGTTGMTVREDIVVDAQDGDDDANTYDNGHEIYLVRTDSPLAYTSRNTIEKTHFVLEDIALSNLAPTSGSDPHTFVAYAKDRFGLRSDSVVRRIEVVAFPSWLEGGESGITFDLDSNTYEMEFRVQAVNYKKTLSQMLGVNVPFVGDWQNEFLVEARASGTASLNPAAGNLSLNPEVMVKLTVLDQEIFDRTFRSGSNLDANISVNGLVQLDSHSLEATQLQLGFALNDLFLGNFEGPEIPIFGFDAGVVAAAVQAQVLGEARANAAVTMTFDLTGNGAPIALVSPTFIGLDLSLELRFEGELEVLGFDIASVGGGFIFTLKPKFGLEHTDTPVNLDDFFDQACFELSATVGGELSASVLGFEVYSVEFESDPINFTDCDVETLSGQSLSPQSHVTHTVAKAASVPPAIAITKTRPGGADPIGPITPQPSPQIVVHPSTGEQLYTYLDYQMVNGQPTAPTLNFARGNDNGFATPTVLPTSEFVTRPILAATHDGAGFPAVLVYQAAPMPDSATTRSAFLTGQDIVYRYYNGTSWSEEIPLTNDALVDMQVSVAFNGAGRGVVTWVKNMNAAPLGADGVFVASANEVYGAVWNPVAHRFGAPVRLSAQSARDSLPTAFVSADGTHYVAWIYNSSQVYLSRSTGGAWAATRVLTTSLPAGDLLSVGLGESSGKLSVFQVFQANPVPHTPTRTFVVSRSGTYAQLSATGPVDVVAATGGISNLRALTAPDGSLVLSWHERRGSFSDVVALRKPAGIENAAWQKPARLTQSSGQERAASVAVAPDGTYRVVFERGARFSGPPAPQDGPVLATPAGSLGLVGSNRVAIAPEISFTRPISFAEYSAEGSAQAVGVIGGTATALTEILNSGHQAAEVTLRYQVGGGPVVEQKIKLAAGASYSVRHAFTLLAGSNRISIRVASSAAESFTSANNAVTAEIKGVGDFAIDNVSVTPAVFGANASISYRVVNRGFGSFQGPMELTTFWIDPAKPTLRTVLRTVTGNISFTPAAGAFQGSSPIVLDRLGLTLVGVEAKFGVEELTLANNRALAAVDLRPDLALVPVEVVTRFGTIFVPPLAVAVQNSSGVANALVAVTVSNTGKAPISGFRLKILHSLNDGPAREVSNQILNTGIAPGAHTDPIEIKVPALAGHNEYRAVVELIPADLPKAGEPNRADNTALAGVVLQGLPDLAIASIRSNVSGNPPSVRTGQAMRLDVDVRNIGIAAASNILMEVFATGPRGGERGPLVGRVVVDRIEALSARTIQIAIDTGSLELDTQALRVVIDRHERILERSDRNNDASLKIVVQPPVVQNTGYSFNSGAKQLSQVSSITFTFNRDLRTNVAAGSLVLANLDTGAAIPAAQLSVLVNSTARTVTWSFPGLAPGEYEARLAGRTVADTVGNLLTRDVVVRFVVTPGDANGDGRTNDRDYLFVFQQLRKAEAARDLSGDVNGDGKVDLLDLDFVKKNYARSGAQTLTPLVPAA